MLYLLDANTLINAKNDFYQFDRVPEFWDWLVYHGEQGNIKISVEIYDEFRDTKNSAGKKDALAEWADLQNVKAALLLEEQVDPTHIQNVIKNGYKLSNVTDQDTEEMGQDPFLISYVYNDNRNPRCIVTAEGSKITQTGARSKIPDICDILGIKHHKPVDLINILDFRTNFKR